MSIKRRLTDLENQANGQLRHDPLVIIWRDGEPHFKKRPETKDQAITLIRKRMRSESLLRASDLPVPMDLIMVEQGSSSRPIREWMMDTFNISPAEL